MKCLTNIHVSVTSLFGKCIPAYYDPVTHYGRHVHINLDACTLYFNNAGLVRVLTN